jgi:hypothetical protein
MNESDYFWRLVNTPGYWQDAARDLICAANLLKKDYRAAPRLGFARRGRLSPYAALRQRHTSPRAIIVLYALAIENMLKGIIVATGQDPIGVNGRIQTWFANHKLVELARRAGVVGLKKDLLHQLTEFITAGKYPVGLEDGDGARAHGYFPDTVLAGVEGALPVLEERLAAVPCTRRSAGQGRPPRAVCQPPQGVEAGKGGRPKQPLKLTRQGFAVASRYNQRMATEEG